MEVDSESITKEKFDSLKTNVKDDRIKGLIVGDYNVEHKRDIDYLFDYSKFLIREKIHDNSIIDWQAERVELLKRVGLDYNDLKKRAKEREETYYKFPDLIKSIETRLIRHNNLAPPKDIAKKFNNEDYNKIIERSKTKKLNAKNQKQINNINSITNVDNQTSIENSANQENKANHDVQPNLENNINNVIQPNKENNNNPDVQPNQENQNEEINEHQVEDINENQEHSVNMEEESSFHENEMENKYDLNDSFLDDEDAELENNEEDEFYNFTLAYGNYTEEEVITNLEKNVKLKEKTKVKKINTNISTRDPGTTEAFENRKTNGTDENVIDSLNVPGHDDEISLTIKEATKKGIPEDFEGKLNLIRRVIPNYKKMSEAESKDLIKRFVGMIKMDYSDVKYLMDLETFKGKRDGAFSHLAKLVNQFVSFLSENNFKKIIIEDVFEQEEIKIKINSIAEKIVNFINATVATNRFIEENKETSDRLFTNAKNGYITESEAKGKVIDKFRENLGRKEIEYNTLILVHSLNKAINEPREAGHFFQDDNYSIGEQEESESGDKNQNETNDKTKGRKKNINSQRKKKVKPDEDESGSKEIKEKKSKQRQSKNSKSKEKKSKITNYENKPKISKIKKKETSELDSSDEQPKYLNMSFFKDNNDDVINLDYSIKLPLRESPIFSNRFFIRQYQESDFNNPIAKSIN